MEYKKIINLIDNKITYAVAESYDDRITKIQKIHNKIIQKQLQMSMTKKYLKKDIYLQKKNKKLLITLISIQQYNKEYQKIINLLNNEPNQPTKFRTKNSIEINDDAHGTNNIDSQINFKTSMLKSSLCDCSDTYILVKETINGSTSRR